MLTEEGERCEPQGIQDIPPNGLNYKELHSHRGQDTGAS